MKREYDLRDDGEEIRTARVWLWEATQGFDKREEWLAWLVSHGVSPVFLMSAASVPPEYRPFLDEAERVFGIPAWFLAGLFQVESDWNPFALNSETGAFGISQQMPQYWEARWEELRRMGLVNFNAPGELQWDPRAQILAGAMVLAGKFENNLGINPGTVDWQGDGWKSDVRVWMAVAAYKGWAAWDQIEVGAGPDREMVRQVERVVDAADRIRNVRVVWPVPGYEGRRHITGWFLEPRTLPDGRPYLHAGIDIAAPEGTPAVAAAPGVVTFVGWMGDYGYTITYRSADHLLLYAHLVEGSAKVRVGDAVNPGQVIGLVGNTGRSAGPHLHFEVRDLRSNTLVDPGIFLGVGPTALLGY